MPNFNISEWKGKTKIATLIAAVVTLVACSLTFVFNITIPGLSPIALGVTLFGLGLKELNEFKETKKRFELILGIIIVAIFVVNCYIGIEQIQNYVFSLVGM